MLLRRIGDRSRSPRPADQRTRSWRPGKGGKLRATGIRLAMANNESAILAAEPVSVRDPVCGMTVDPAAARHRSEHAGHTYYFCSTRCRERFADDPARYLSPTPPVAAAATAGDVRWTCPMHPQVVRN